MATKSGTDATVKLGTNTIANLAKWSLTDETEPLKAPVFGTIINKVHGMGIRNLSGSIEGFLDIDDTNGQEALKTAYEDRAKIIDFRLFIDGGDAGATGSNYYYSDTGSDPEAGVYMTSMSIGAANNEIIPVTFNFEVTGAWARGVVS